MKFLFVPLLLLVAWTSSSAAPAHAGWPILTPRPGPQPKINGPEVYACRPGHPFLYRIPATGDRKTMAFSAENLAPGLHLDPTSGIITGSVAQQGHYTAILHATNLSGSDHRTFEIVCGQTLALTPPMGWNDWYAYYHRVTDPVIRQAADLMIANGMADVGYQYVDVDDCWMNAAKSEDPRRVGPLRNSHGDIVPNSYFPDMAGLTAYIHARGFKAGIYSSPGLVTCGMCEGSYGHEAQDARQFAQWGFDLLKYDWCHYGEIPGVMPLTLEKIQRPFRLMGGLLEQQDRDIMFSLCEGGMGDVWKWGTKVGAQGWRTASDFGPKQTQFFSIALGAAERGEWVKPGAWNDPDYILIGYLGHPQGYTKWHSPEGWVSSTADEQYAMMSLWCLTASPLFYSGILAKTDDFTLNVLCNPEVIAIDQDRLGHCARVAAHSGDGAVLVKDLADGSKAIGLVNSGDRPIQMGTTWADLKLAGPCQVRDLWREKDLGPYTTGFGAEVRAHSVVLVKAAPIGIADNH